MADTCPYYSCYHFDSYSYYYHFKLLIVLLRPLMTYHDLLYSSCYDLPLRLLLLLVALRLLLLLPRVLDALLHVSSIWLHFCSALPCMFDRPRQSGHLSPALANWGMEGKWREVEVRTSIFHQCPAYCIPFGDMPARWGLQPFFTTSSACK